MALFPGLYIVWIFISIVLAIIFQNELFLFTLLPFHFLTIIFIFYLLIKSTSVISAYQKRTGRILFDPIAFFFMTWFYIIGIWMIQPKLRQEIIELKPELELENDEAFTKTQPNLLKRIFAFLIDYFTLGFLFFIAFQLLKNSTDENTGFYLLFKLVGLWFTLLVIIETIFEATIGNYILGLKVVKKRGTRIKLWHSFIRHFFDIYDIWPLGIIGICAIKFTNHNQRLGDLFANTIVIQRS